MGERELSLEFNPIPHLKCFQDRNYLLHKPNTTQNQQKKSRSSGSSNKDDDDNIHNTSEYTMEVAETVFSYFFLYLLRTKRVEH